MILPLHHCAATGCLELLDPDEFMCRAHWKKVSHRTMVDVVWATEADDIERSRRYAILEVAAIEGLIHLPPDASRASNQPPVSPSAAGIEGKTP